MLITQKYGTDTNTVNGQLDLNHVRAISDAVHKHTRHAKKRVILVVSGAKALGKAEIGQREIELDSKLNSQLVQQITSGVGQAELMRVFKENFARHNRAVLPLLSTKEDLLHYRVAEILKEATKAGIVPLCNANDVFTFTELDRIRTHTDNDELARTIAEISGSDQLHYGTNIDGVFDGSPASSTSKIIKHISAHEITDDLINEITSGTSQRGTGGMASKLRQAAIAIEEGVKKVLIFNGKNHQAVNMALSGEDVGTVITK